MNRQTLSLSCNIHLLVMWGTRLTVADSRKSPENRPKVLRPGYSDLTFDRCARFPISFKRLTD